MVRNVNMKKTKSSKKIILKITMSMTWIFGFLYLVRKEMSLLNGRKAPTRTRPIRLLSSRRQASALVSRVTP